MAKRGPAPKPAKLKILEGTYRADRDGPLGSEPAVEAPPMPGWLSKRAKAEWKRIVPELLSLGLLSQLDLAALTAYCVAVSELEAATAMLEKDGRVCVWPILDKFGEKIGERLKAHPCVAMQRSAASLVRAFQAEFGLSPSGRNRVKGTAPAAGNGDGRGHRFFGGSRVRTRQPTTLDRQGKPT